MLKHKSTSYNLPRRFETIAFARSEDETRARRLRETIEIRVSQGSAGQALIPFDTVAAGVLVDALERRKASESLASFTLMRELRLTIIQALHLALKPFDDEQLRIVTVINEQWCLSPEQLNQVSAASIKRQFRAHLQRGGVFDQPGFLIGFLHGEYEPSKSRYQLHYHLVTTKQRAEALVEGLKGRWGYVKTATGAASIKCQKLRDRPVQLSYLLKAFWPERPVVVVNAVVKRIRDGRRIREPFHSQVLLWLDAQRLNDIMVVNGGDFRGTGFHFRK